MMDFVRNSQLDAIALVTKHVVELVQLDAVALVVEPVLPLTVREYQLTAMALTEDPLVPENFAPCRAITQVF
ncbi:MAG: hypothetical protein U1E42_03575 [Rhodospirillales bacterium]